MRVELTPANENKARLASQTLNRSINELTNMLWEQLELVDIKQVITIKLHKDPEMRGKPGGSVVKSIRRIGGWKVKL